MSSDVSGGSHFTSPNDADTTVQRRPGWPEIIVGLLALVASAALIPVFGPAISDADPVLYGLVLAAASGAGGLIGFAAAFLVRLRSWSAFGVRKASWRWILIGIAAGVVALVVKGLVNMLVLAFTGPLENVQVPYYDAAGGGVFALILTVLFLAVLTPIGEEFFFRGVIMTALLRYGPVLAVVVSSALFALFHGINITLPSAFVVGLIAAEVYRRSGSIWPAVLVHGVNNLALPALVLITGVSGEATF